MHLNSEKMIVFSPRQKNAMKIQSTVIASFFLLSCASLKHNVPPATAAPASLSGLAGTELHVIGRYRTTPSESLELISTGAHFGFTFEGRSCRMLTSLAGSGHNYLQYEMDGAYQKKIRLDGPSSATTLTASTDGKHTVWIYKATEATSGPIFIQRIDGTNVQPLSIPRLPLIEFIGNSITSGALSDPSEVPCGKGEYLDQHNAYYAYGPRVARALGVNFMISSVSGIGIYRNWNSDGPAMPQVYTRPDFLDATPETWNFSLFPPEIVSIELGTNDFSNGDGSAKRKSFDTTAFINGYLSFLITVKSKYPTAQIALLSSPAVTGGNARLLEAMLQLIKQKIDQRYPNDRTVAVFYFKPMELHGCIGHPSVEDHAAMAAALAPFYRGLLR